MASELIYKYPLDLSGVSSTNFVSSEPHVLPVGDFRPIVPNNGAYYGDTLEVYDGSGTLLSVNVDYKKAQFYQAPTIESGKEVYTAIVITNSSLSTVTLKYQVVGGDYSFSVKALRETLSAIELDSRTVDWKNLIDIPDAFPPSPHLHSAGDVYGFEYLVDILEQIRRAILIGNEASLVSIIGRIDYLQSLIIPPATLDEAVQGLRDDVVLTPKTAKGAFDYWASLYIGDPIRSEVFQVHVAITNPHDTNGGSILLSNVSNVPLLTLDVIADSLVPLTVG